MKTQEEFNVLIKKNGSKNKGWLTERLKFNPKDLENAFSSHWIKENKPEAGINQGKGILQNLFYSHVPPQALMFRGKKLLKITFRDRLIVATVIQWLGTNCGLCFLREALKKAGYEIVKIKD